MRIVLNSDYQKYKDASSSYLIPFLTLFGGSLTTLAEIEKHRIDFFYDFDSNLVGGERIQKYLLDEYQTNSIPIACTFGHIIYIDLDTSSQEIWINKELHGEGIHKLLSGFDEFISKLSLDQIQMQNPQSIQINYSGMDKKIQELSNRFHLWYFKLSNFGNKMRYGYELPNRFLEFFNIQYDRQLIESQLYNFVLQKYFGQNKMTKSYDVILEKFNRKILPFVDTDTGDYIGFLMEDVDPLGIYVTTATNGIEKLADSFEHYLSLLSPVTEFEERGEYVEHVVIDNPYYKEDQ